MAHHEHVDPVEALERLGGIARREDLLTATSARRLRSAVHQGTVKRVGRGRYALPVTDQGRRAAIMCQGVLTHLSAALHWGWAVRLPPRRPQIAVPAGRGLRSARAAEVRPLSRRASRDGWATDRLSTVLLCARDLPFADALAVADSALRAGDLTTGDLTAAARSAAERRVALHATARAANPFESALRAIVIDAGRAVVPQYEIRAGGLVLHPDLVDPIHGVVVEAESWEFHGKEPRAFESDCERYNALTATGWRILRFTWVQVIHRPDDVRRCLQDLYRDLGPAPTPSSTDQPASSSANWVR